MMECLERRNLACAVGTVAQYVTAETRISARPTAEFLCRKWSPHASPLISATAAPVNGASDYSNPEHSFLHRIDMGAVGRFGLQGAR